MKILIFYILLAVHGRNRAATKKDFVQVGLTQKQSVVNIILAEVRAGQATFNICFYLEKNNFNHQ